MHGSAPALLMLAGAYIHTKTLDQVALHGTRWMDGSIIDMMHARGACMIDDQ